MVAASRADLELNGPVVLDGIEAKLGYPIFVKPANAGSSVGISKVADRAALEKGVEIALREDDKVVFEEFVDAQESSAPPSATPMTRPPSPRPARARSWPGPSSTPTTTSTKTACPRPSSPRI